jgi:hypothetical protein
MRSHLLRPYVKSTKFTEYAENIFEIIDHEHWRYLENDLEDRRQ